jgi:transcriptional regulator with XRE-family HTH domain
MSPQRSWCDPKGRVSHETWWQLRAGQLVLVMAIDPRQLGSVIAKVRRARGLTQQTLARKAQLTPNYVSLIEKGQRTPSLDALNQLGRVLEVPPEFIAFLGTDTPPGNGQDHPFGALARTTRQALAAAVGIRIESS